MPVIYEDIITDGSTVNLPDLASASVLAGVQVVSTSYYGMTGGTGHMVTVLGSVFGLAGGVWLGNGAASAASRLTIGSSGVINSVNFGIALRGPGSSVINHGEVIAGGTAFFFGYSNADPIRLINYGNISGNTALGADGPSSNPMLNLTNYGTITGSFAALYTGVSTGTVRIVNQGIITGDLNFGGGADYFDNRSGIYNGVALGGAGNDIFIGNPNQGEVFNGGDGVDTLDFRYAGSVILALDLSRANAGQALGDQYFNFENIFGSQQNDILTGSNINNVLTGEDGNDWLHGRGGNDILRGGPGADTMAGGTGNDLFQYMHIDDAGDTIMDFLNIAGNNDAFHISATGFGGGLAAGVLAASAFQSGTTNVAATADIRFLYRTTDNTVWYDADGNGSGAAVLLATLQSGATLSNADFLIF